MRWEIGLYYYLALLSCIMILHYYLVLLSCIIILHYQLTLLSYIIILHYHLALSTYIIILHYHLTLSSCIIRVSDSWSYDIRDNSRKKKEWLILNLLNVLEKKINRSNEVTVVSKAKKELRLKAYSTNFNLKELR